MVKKVLMILLVGGLVAGSSLPALADGEVELHKLTASDAAGGDNFGYSAAISGATALVGANGNDDAGGNSGSAYLFDVATGSQLFKLTASDANAGDRFGYSVAISGSIALVGAYGDDDAGSSTGSAYLFDFSDPCSIIETKLTASDAAGWDQFGCSVAISGSTAIVGALNDDSESGSAYLFDVATGSQITKLTAPGPFFGISVAISGSTALVGAHWHANGSGAAYLFDVARACPFAPVADINLDCRVDLRDFALMAGNWLVDCVFDPCDPACLGP